MSKKKVTYPEPGESLMPEGRPQPDIAGALNTLQKAAQDSKHDWLVFYFSKGRVELRDGMSNTLARGIEAIEKWLN